MKGDLENGRYLAWVDIETTGLDPEYDLVLEVGLQITDHKLRPVGSETVVIGYPGQWWFSMAPFVKQMHEKSGLLAECQAENALSVRDAEKKLLPIMDHFFPAAPPPPMCGSSIHFDRSFLRSFMPNFHNKFSYRNIDVSSIKELARLWAPHLIVPTPPEDKAHRALDDIRASIAELQWYSDHRFIDPTGGN